jgi:uncharacterized SAM-binding protein YcdF (DUF218 family)
MIARFLSFLLVSWLLGFVWFAVDLPKAAGDPTVTDSVVVLTGGPKRIDRGLQVLREKQAQRMLISGVDRNVKAKELAAEYAEADDLFACCIDLGLQAVDTRSNALETARWVAERKDKSVRLVTSDWHMFRAELELKQAMPPNVTIIPDAVQTSPRLMTLFTEYNKYITRWVAAQLGV